MEKIFELHIENCFKKAENYISKIDKTILLIDGMTGTKTRHFYNNLLSIPGLKYLEIGTWKGSSVCSAMSNNTNTIVCIDNWSEFNGPKTEFIRNFEKFKGSNIASFIEADCFSLDVSTFSNSFNVFLYDGEHSYLSHKKALTHYYSCLDNTFIYIIDDWNFEQVRKGTLDSIIELNLKVLYFKQIRTNFDNSHSLPSYAFDNWWNGICVLILQKQ
jgi:hypothetical protein